VATMKLDVYRGCTREEKREVLGVFWRAASPGSSRIAGAAEQYGAVAIIDVATIALEVLVVMVARFRCAAFLGWLALVAEAFVLWALWWSVVRYRALRRRRV